MNHTHSVSFWINRAKANKTGKMPIYARLTVSGKRAEIDTGVIQTVNDGMLKKAI